MINKTIDILIVGGGLTGALLMLALAHQGYCTLLIDTSPLDDKIKDDFDARTLALSPASVCILQMLNVWSPLQQEATPIKTVHISEQSCFGSTRLESSFNKPLGYVVETQVINRVINDLLDTRQIMAPAQLIALEKEKGIATIRTVTDEIKICAKLIVAADGTSSSVRRLSALPVKTKDYQQQALVANIGLARAHRNIAYERFTPSGPLALLPMTRGRASLVWALDPNDATQMMTVDEQTFLKALQNTFGYRLGRFMQVGKRVIYPLRQMTMPAKTAWPLVFVGNAAQTLHPVAGQGFNLGLRDVAMLAQCITQRGLNESMLLHYQLMRKHDEKAIICLTNGLVDLFTSRLPGLSLARHLSLFALDNLSFLQRGLMRYTCGFAGITPDLACGIHLSAKESP